MRRKLIKQGESAFTITLPIKWIREHNLDKEKEVTVEEQKPNLIISAPFFKQDKKIEIDVSPYEDRIILFLIDQAYCLGYDIIQVKFKGRGQFETIENIVAKNILGFEIIEEKENTCTLQNIAEPDEKQADVIFRRLFIQVLSLSENITEDLKKGKHDITRYQGKRDQLIKLTNYILRNISRNKKEGPKALLEYSFTQRLYKISSAYIYMYIYACENRIKLDKESLDHLKKVNAILKDFYAAVMQENIDMMADLDGRKPALLEENRKLIEKSKGDKKTLYSNIWEIVARIQISVHLAIGIALENKNSKE